jgi:hypothetical protein
MNSSSSIGSWFGGGDAGIGDGGTGGSGVDDLGLASSLSLCGFHNSFLFEFFGDVQMTIE